VRSRVQRSPKASLNPRTRQGAQTRKTSVSAKSGAPADELRAATRGTRQQSSPMYWPQGPVEEQPAPTGLMTVTVRRRIIAKTPELAVMLTAASIVRMVVPSLALVAAGGALLFLGVPQVRREQPVDAGAGTAASRPTVGAASLAAPYRSSDAGNDTPVFDIARIDPTGDAVIAGRVAPGVNVELLRNGYVHDRAVADRSGQFVMVPPRLPPGDYELTLRSRQPNGKEATSKRSVVVTLQPKLGEAPMTLDKQQSITVPPKIVEAPMTLDQQEPIAVQPKIVEAPMTLDKQKAGIAVQPKIDEAPMTLDKQEAGVAAYQRGDFAAAFQLFQPLAERGDASAQSNLGVMYEQGRGVAQNYREAMRWFRLAAVQGNASAQSNLGVMYYKGQGIAQDYGEAMKWYRLAAEQRNPEAQFNLGVMYEEGRGVAQDRVRAHMWYNLAAAVASDQNGKLAARNRDLITKSLTREQLFRAQEMAHQCEASSFKNCD
jgi:uncharacterized protein